MVRCAKQGLLFSPLDRECHQPLSPGPCPDGEMLVLDTDTLMGRCTVQHCKDRDLVWDETQQSCKEIYGREVRQTDQLRVTSVHCRVVTGPVRGSCSP